MNFQIKTEVKGNFLDVYQKFDIKLFEALKPKFGAMEIIEFSGSKKGDRVHLQFLKPIQTEWISIITEDKICKNEAFFIDEGLKLPKFISYWRHKHIVKSISKNTSLIVDDITFKGTYDFVTPFLFPFLYWSFVPRRKVYQDYFDNLYNKSTP